MSARAATSTPPQRRANGDVEAPKAYVQADPNALSPLQIGERIEAQNKANSAKARSISNTIRGNLNAPASLRLGRVQPAVFRGGNALTLTQVRLASPGPVRALRIPALESRITLGPSAQPTPRTRTLEAKPTAAATTSATGSSGANTSAKNIPPQTPRSPAVASSSDVDGVKILTGVVASEAGVVTSAPPDKKPSPEDASSGTFLSSKTSNEGGRAQTPRPLLQEIRTPRIPNLLPATPRASIHSPKPSFSVLQPKLGPPGNQSRVNIGPVRGRRIFTGLGDDYVQHYLRSRSRSQAPMVVVPPPSSGGGTSASSGAFSRPPPYALDIDMAKNTPRHPAFEIGGMEDVHDMIGLSSISLSIEPRRACTPLQAHPLSPVPHQILHVPRPDLHPRPY
ncbi:unnamed protein product [Amoebophrya sp. A120]|nr:unnamed protein product [Amoebophrya sp. A120]|eukprot:GSA120T00022967001.1